MGHPDWGRVYEKKLELCELIDHVYSHKPYLLEIWKAKPAKVLEVGVGGGSTSIFLSYLGIEAHAIDNDPTVISRARENNSNLMGRLEIKEGDAYKLPYPNDSFDVVCHQGFFEHFADDEIRLLLKEQLRVAPQVIFSVPTKYYMSTSLGERLMTKGRWERILKDFRIAISSYYGRPRSETLAKRFLSALGWKNIYYYAVVKR
jgi:SAM-dependent methyltransferase